MTRKTIGDNQTRYIYRGPTHSPGFAPGAAFPTSDLSTAWLDVVRGPRVKKIRIDFFLCPQFPAGLLPRCKAIHNRHETNFTFSRKLFSHFLNHNLPILRSRGNSHSVERFNSLKYNQIL
jgi:hypothetical protein